MATPSGGTTHPPGDDFTAEVSNLDVAPAPDAGRAGASGGAVGRVPLDGRLSPHQRATRQLTIVGVLGLALLLVLGTFPAARDQAARALLGQLPFPSSTLPAGAGYVYVAAGAPWARVSIDGRAIARLPEIGVDPPLWLPPGRHTIVWHADPFAPVRCVLSTPIASSDTCPYDRVHLSQPEASPSEWIVTLFPTLAMLSADQHAALLQAAQAALATLSSTTTLRPSERYGTVYLPAVAAQPLRATLSFQLITTSSQNQSCVNGGNNLDCGELGQDCVQFCTVPVAGRVGYWSAYAVASSFWTYATLAGQPVLESQSDVPQWEGSGILIPLRITWDGARWSVTAVTAAPQIAYDSYLNPATGGLDIDPACLAPWEALVVQRGSVLPAPTDSLYDLLNWRFIAAPQRADGCVAQATIQDYTVIATPATPPPPPLLLQRFGVLLAANAVAHRLWPALPVADAYEQQLAAQIVTSGQGATAGGDGNSR